MRLTADRGRKAVDLSLPEQCEPAKSAWLGFGRFRGSSRNAYLWKINSLIQDMHWIDMVSFF